MHLTLYEFLHGNNLLGGIACSISRDEMAVVIRSIQRKASSRRRATRTHPLTCIKEWPHENLESLRMITERAVSDVSELHHRDSQLCSPRIVAGYVEPGGESLNAVEPPWLAVIDGICSDEKWH